MRRKDGSSGCFTLLTGVGLFVIINRIRPRGSIDYFRFGAGSLTIFGKSSISLFICAGVLIFLTSADRSAKNLRHMPVSGETRGAFLITRVGSQRDVYAIYRNEGLWGARVVHLNRDMNFVDYFPNAEVRTAPFPLVVYDTRSEYEKGIDSHNWLFVATRTGMVRAVTSVLPDAGFVTKSAQFSDDPTMVYSRGAYYSFAYDVPWVIAPLDALPVILEPVVVNVDAGFFASGADPEKTAALLRSRLKDIRMMVIVQSDDEPGLPQEALAELEIFERSWKTL